MTTELKKSSTSIVCLRGNISQVNGGRMEDQVSKLLESRCCTLLYLNMREVELIDCYGLRAITSVCLFAKRRNCEILLCQVQPSVKLVFEIAGLDVAFQFSEQLPMISNYEPFNLVIT